MERDMAESGVCGSKGRELRAHISTFKEEPENELGMGRGFNLEGFESLSSNDVLPAARPPLLNYS